MRRLMRRVIERVAHLLLLAARNVYSSPQGQLLRTWFAAQGGKILRLEYELNGSSAVFLAVTKVSGPVIYSQCMGVL